MRGWSRSAVLGVLGVTVLAGASVAGVIAGSPASATTVTDEASFRTAWASDTQIDLSADVALTCTDGPGDGVAVRNSTNAISVNGHGHVITQTCATGTNNGVLTQTGSGAVTLQNVTITGGNAVNGGGIWDVGDLTLTNSTVRGNHATADAAGMYVVGSVMITDSTISGNTTPSFGGGVDGSGSVTIINSTISGNTASNGAGVVTSNSGSVTLVYATVVQNTAPRAANLATFSITSFGSVVAMPLGGGTNCTPTSVTTTSEGFNYSDDADVTTSCKFNSVTDRIGSTNNPMLGALADNGGPTQTQLPQTGSPLIDAIPTTACEDGNSLAGFNVTTDQRGVFRPQRDGCDIGAVEVEFALALPPSEPTTPSVPGNEPTTTTTTTTVPSIKPPVTPAAQAVAVQPQFTG